VGFAARDVQLHPGARESAAEAARPTGTYPVVTFCVASLAVLAAVLPTVGGFLIDRSETGLRLEPWRAVTGNMVHASLAHLAGNLLVFLPLASWRESCSGRPRFLGELLALACAVALTVRLLHPDWTTYCGLSGVVYGLLSLILVDAIERPRRREARPIAAVLLGAVILKTALEIRHGGWVWGGVAMEESLGIRYLAGSHVGGLVGGALLALFGGAAQRKPVRAGEAVTLGGSPPPASL
jgi:rhomboid family GlyGly-CTERM serine protease